MSVTLENAPTQYVEADGVRFAYRRLGLETGRPLVLLQHFTGTMDSWDPAVVDELARDRPVIVFDNAGVGASGGATPDNADRMAAYAEAFIGALDIEVVDLLGYSLGGFLAQVMASRAKVAVRKLVLAGTAPKGGEEYFFKALEDADAMQAPDVRLPLFFTPSSSSQEAGRAFVARAAARTRDRDPESGDSVRKPQAKAVMDWCAETDPDHRSLRAIHQPTLIVHGSDDTMFPSINPYLMFKNMANATLILYPDSGHGALFQHHKAFVAHVRTFLDA